MTNDQRRPTAQTVGLLHESSPAWRDCGQNRHNSPKSGQLMLAEGRAARAGHSRRLAARLMRELRNDPPSMYQTRCQCAACRQAIPPIPFSAHQLLAKLLVPEGETKPRPPRTRPNRRRAVQRQAA